MTAEPVPSVLPEEGLDLRAELARYKDWLIEQALVRTNGSVHAAAKLVRVSAETIYARTRDARIVRKRVPPEPVAEPPAAPAPVPRLELVPPPEVTPAPPSSPPPPGVVRVRRSDVARLRGEGWGPNAIAWELGCSKRLVDRILSTPGPLRKCEP